MNEPLSTQWNQFSRWLYHHLHPIYHQQACKTTFMKGSDAVQAIQQYQQQGYLKSSTLFVTLHIQHLLSMFDHDQLIIALKKFLDQAFPSNEIENIPIPIILELIRMMFNHQYLIYNGKLYQHKHGSSDRSSLMVLFVNILLFDWEQEWIDQLKEKNEIYGRFIF